MRPEVFDMFAVGFACLLAGFLLGVLFACITGRCLTRSKDFEEFASKIENRNRNGCRRTTGVILALFAVLMLSSDAQAGPIRNLFARFQQRRAERVAERWQPTASPSCSTCSQPQAVPSGDCPDGRCPLQRRAVVVPTSQVVVFATPQRMP